MVQTVADRRGNTDSPRAIMGDVDDVSMPVVARGLVWHEQRCPNRCRRVISAMMVRWQDS